MSKLKVKFEDWFAIITSTIIVAITLSFGTRESPLDYTLSMIGNRFDAYLEFVIWGITTAGLLILLVLHIFKLGAFKHKKARENLIWSGIFLVLTVLTPAIEELWPILHRLHAVYGALFGFSLVASIYYFLKYIKAFDDKFYSISFFLLMLSVGGSITLLFLFGNTGLFELFFFISITLVLLFLEVTMRRHKE